jgi:predicted RNA binding protein YcfA (HicA-like mRNA interferase family)
MTSLSRKELCGLLERNGWSLVRIHGSHHHYTKFGNPNLLSVPVRGNKPLQTGMLKALLQKDDLLDKT